MNVSEMILEIFIRRGGSVDEIDSRGYDRDPRLKDLSLRELKDLLSQNTREVDSFQDMDILLAPGVWLDLPWDVGVPLFRHVFYKGERSPEFLSLCRKYLKTLGGPDGEEYLREFRTQLCEEGNDEMAEQMS